MASTRFAEEREDHDERDAWLDRVIDGRYRVRAQLGAGGMGVVYRVEHLRLRKVAAMKVLHRELATHPGAIKRFRREVEVVSRLDHPNIVQTFDSGHADGQLYLIMEYIRGEDLGTVVRRDGALPAPRALALAIQVCAALEEAHERGIVHCDLKPENIVCVRRRDLEHAKVLDFGLAKLREGPEPGETTQSIVLAGTPSYMSPEQVQFERVDPRSDLYSLGATLYQLLTGATAFEASSPIEIMARHLTAPLVPPSLRAPALDLPAAVDRVIVRAMARRREDRYATAAEMRDELQAAFNLLTGVTPPRRTTSRDGACADPRGPAAGSDESLERLGRDDFDAFERRLRRRRLAGTFLGAPLVLGGLGLGAWVAASLPRPGLTSEREPNDQPAVAGVLSPGLTVSGQLGAARAGGPPDFDYYRIPAGAGTRAVTARITGVPDMDLVLELFDERGQLVVRANNLPAGGDEWLGPAAIGSGAAFVRARPMWTVGEAPGAGKTSAPYALTVDWTTPRADWELEPNDTPADARPVDPGAITGYLTTGDEDWFRVRVPAGSRLVGRVDGLDGVDLAVLLGAERRRIDQRGSGEHESFSVVSPADGMVLIGVAARAASPPSPGERDEPYTLKLRLKPQEPPPVRTAAKRT